MRTRTTQGEMPHSNPFPLLFGLNETAGVPAESIPNEVPASAADVGTAPNQPVDQSEPRADHA